MTEDSLPYGNDHNMKEFTYEQLIESNVLTLEALFRVLERKGLVNKSELFDAIKEVQEEDREKRQQDIDKKKGALAPFCFTECCKFPYLHLDTQQVVVFQ